jgi:phosphonate transport system substrate-binding protein
MSSKVRSILLIILLATSFLYAKDKLLFAPLPIQEKRVLYENFAPMISYLEKKLNREIEFVFFESYQEVLDNFQKGTIDLTYLGPLPYVTLKRQFSHTKALVAFKDKNGYAAYTCSLVTSLNTQEKKRVALTQPSSTCGYLCVNALLDKKLENYKYRYVGRHDLVALAILEGKYDLGGLKTGIYKKYYHLGLQEIKRTKPFPMFALVANTKNLSSKTSEAIIKVLTEATKEEIQHWGELIKYGVQKIDDSDYAPIKKMLDKTDIPQEGNI